VPIGVPAAGAPTAPEPRPPEAAPPSAPPATTLGASSGQLSLAARKRRTLWVAALAIAAATAGIAIAIAVPKSSTRPPSALPAPSLESAPASKPIAEDPARAQPSASATPPLAPEATAAPPPSAREPAISGDAAKASASGATPGTHAEPHKRRDADAGSARPAVGVPASAKTRPAPAAKIVPPSAPQSTSAKRGDPPTPPPEPAAPPVARCSKAAFAAVYNAAAPSRDDVHAALRTLNACRAAGSLTESEYEQTRDALVTRL
jgi:hypothetical protein